MRIPHIPPRRLHLLLALFSAAMLGFALAGQYGFGWHPCDLCLLQRYPYAAIIALSGACWLLVKSPRWLMGAAIACAALLAIDAGIAAYHAGVELGWFPGPSACSSGDSANMTIEEMRAAILSAPLVSCSQAMVHIFGLSLAAWNALMASIMMILTILLIRKA